jgi:hypothetical protein
VNSGSGWSARSIAYNKVAAAWPGLRHANIIKTGEHTFCIIAEWTNMDAIANARPSMIATLGSFRDLLEDLGGGLGVTDPVSGPVVKGIAAGRTATVCKGTSPEGQRLTRRLPTVSLISLPCGIISKNNGCDNVTAGRPPNGRVSRV